MQFIAIPDISVGKVGAISLDIKGSIPTNTLFFFFFFFLNIALPEYRHFIINPATLGMCASIIIYTYVCACVCACVCVCRPNSCAA